MDPKIVKQLENEIEEAIARVIKKLGPQRLPLLPNHHTLHLMSKAAVTVYETAVQNQQPEELH